jgi:hypothetical protein
MTQTVPKLITVGVMATEFGEPLHRVLHVLATRPHIHPSARVPYACLYGKERRDTPSLSSFLIPKTRFCAESGTHSRPLSASVTSPGVRAGGGESRVADYLMCFSSRHKAEGKAVIGDFPMAPILSGLINSYFAVLPQAAVAAGLLGFLLVIVLAWLGRRTLALDNAVHCALAASAVPPGVALMLCAFDPAFLARMSDIGVYLAVAAAVLIWVSLKVVFHSSRGHRDGDAPGLGDK